MAAIDNGPWDGPAAMSRCAGMDDPAAAYAAICAGRREGDPSLQATWALPHHTRPGAPPNAAGVRNSESRLPQTQGLINREAAQRHLDAHMAQIRGEASADDLDYLAAEHPHIEASVDFDIATAEIVDETGEPDEPITLELPDERVVSLSVNQRRLGVRIMPYNTVAVHPEYGALMFQPGAFGSVDPHSVRLRMDHQDPPTGLGSKFWEQADGAYMEFQLSRTGRADEQLTLAVDGVSRGASVGFSPVPGRSQVQRISGQNVRVYPPDSARLFELSTTWMPTFSDAGVMYVLSRDEKGTGPMAETPQEAAAVAAPVITPAPLDYERLTAAIVAAQADGARTEKMDRLLSAFEQTIELQRSQFNVPAAQNKPKAKLHNWVEFTLRRMRGENMSSGDLKRLALDDVVISEQPGLVPDVFTADYDDLINQDRPFLNSTRRITAPVSGDTLTLPVITTRAVAGTQYGGEKTEVTTIATKVGTGTFNYQSVFGGADLSIQFINRAQPGFFEILTGDMAMAYALDAEAKAIAALLAGYTDSGGNSHVPTSGGLLDPENPNFGDAWVNSITSGYKRAPTHIWLNAQAVGAFIDAKSPTTNAPLYSNLAAAFTAGGGTGGALSGLTPIYVPAMDSSSVDIIIGPARGFVWAEDPALTLQADVPSLAGRDIALAGGIFPAPRYADAFTVYTVTS